MIPNISQLVPYSQGVVAMNKEMSSMFIEVYAYEQNPLADGEITDQIEKYKAKGKDAKGGSFEIELDTTITLRAKWLPIGQTHRRTAPDVRRGELVEIYRFGDSDQFFWIEKDQGTNIRRLETVIWAFSNNKKEGPDNTPDSTYWFEVSTHGQYVHMHTSKSNEEPFAYDFQFNTKIGCVTLTDDDENYFYLDSQERILHMHNRDNSFMEVNKRNITHHCLDTLLQQCDHLIIEAKSTIKTTTKKWDDQTDTYEMNADQWYKTTTPDMKIKADKYLREDKESKVKTEQNYELDIGKDMETTVKGDYRLTGEKNYYAKIEMKWNTKIVRPEPIGQWKVEFSKAEFSGNIEVAGEIKGESYKGGHHG